MAHTKERVMSHKRKSHVKQKKESCHTKERVKSKGMCAIWHMWHDAFMFGPYGVAKTHKMPYFHNTFPQKSPIISGSFAEIDLQFKAYCESSPPCMCDTIHAWGRRDWFMSVTRLIVSKANGAIHRVWHDTFICDLYVWTHSSMRVTWLMQCVTRHDGMGAI